MKNITIFYLPINKLKFNLLLFFTNSFKLVKALFIFN